MSKSSARETARLDGAPTAASKGMPATSAFCTSSKLARPDKGSSGALVAVNGALAGIATIAERERFIRVVWNEEPDEGVYRFFDGVNHLLALLFLSGKFRAY